MAKFAGVSLAATGTINNGSASLLSFSATRKYVIVTNRSGQTAYFKVNDPSGAQLVSATVYDFALADGGTMVLEDTAIDTLGLHVAAASGVRVVGW